MLTKEQRLLLKGESANIDALYQLGKNDIGRSQLLLLENGIAARELIKIKVLKTVTTPMPELAKELAEMLFAEVVDIRGRNISLFKQKKDKSNYKL